LPREEPADARFELYLSPSQFGLLGASFFALFSIAALIVGWLGDRISTKWLLGGMALIWTAAQLALLAPVSLAAFFGYRILLGASEGPALPTALHAAYKWFPDRDRPLVTQSLRRRYRLVRPSLR